MPRTTEVGFSYEWDLKFGGLSLNVPFSGMKFTHTVSGFGICGVSTGKFEFDVYDKFGQFGEALLEHMEVHLENKNNPSITSRNYYISKRSVNNNICHFTAFDIMSNVDQEFSRSLLDRFFNRNETAPCGNVLEEIRLQCGFTSAAASASGLDLIRFTKEQVTNRTCRAILEDIAKAMCGVWITTRQNGIVLSCLGSSYSESASCDKYSKIDYHGKQKITKLICINSDTGHEVEYSTGEYGTVIKIESPFSAANTALDAIVWDRIRNYIYQAWSCKKSRIEIPGGEPFPESTAHIRFGEKTLIANNVRITPNSTGIYISADCDPQDEEQWKYDDYLTRTKIGINEPIGNAAIKNTGRIVYINKNK